MNIQAELTNKVYCIVPNILSEEEIAEVEEQVEEAIAEAEATGKPIPENHYLYQTERTPLTAAVGCGENPHLKVIFSSTDWHVFQTALFHSQNVKSFPELLLHEQAGYFFPL